MGLLDVFRGKKALSAGEVNEFADRLTASELKSAVAAIHGRQGEAAANDFRDKQMDRVLAGVSAADRARVIAAIQARKP